MYTDHKKTREEVIDVVTGNAGSGIMLLLDGFDELTPELRNKSLFVDLINGRRLTNCTVFVTSRPYASQKLQRICNRHIEILGFSLDKIRCFINSAFPKDKERANDLIRDLESREDLLSLCYIPMNCAIIIYVYKGENFHLPNTVTALYELYLTHALRRHASKIGLQEDFDDLKDLPNELECKFGALAEIAYKFLIDDKFVFNQRDLGPNREARTQLQIMGLVTSFSVSSGCGKTQLFQFLHLTIQEFLAAWHASQLSPEEQAGIICHFSNDRLKLMHDFLAGITKLQGQNIREAFNQSFKDSLRRGTQYTDEDEGMHYFIDEDAKNCNGTAVLDQLHMIYEAQSPEVCQLVSRNFPEETIIFCQYRNFYTLFLCKVISFFLSNSSCAWKKVSLDGLLISNTACLQTQLQTQLQIQYGMLYNMCLDYFLHRNQHQSRCNVCSDIMMTHCFELHLQPVSELPPHLQCLSPTLSSLQQIVSTQKCVGKITAHAKKCTPIIEKLEMSKYVSEEDHDCWIYIVVDIRVMGSDHVTVQSQLKWIIDAVKIKCPYVKHSSAPFYIKAMQMYPACFRGDDEDLGDVIVHTPFLKPQHQNSS